MRTLTLSFMLLFSGTVMGKEMLKENVICKGPHQMLPSVLQKYPAGSIILSMNYDKLFENHDVSLTVKGREDLSVMRFYSNKNTLSFPYSCSYNSKNIAIYYDCDSKEFLNGYVLMSDGAYINLNCNLKELL